MWVSALWALRLATNAGAFIGALCIGATAVFYTAEVVARYFFNAPLNWSGDISSYLLLTCSSVPCCSWGHRRSASS